MTATGMKTNGVGNKVDWLNLTVSLADVPPDRQVISIRDKRLAKIARESTDRYLRRGKYAGADK